MKRLALIALATALGCSSALAADLSCGPAKPALRQLLDSAASDPDLKLFTLEGIEARVYLDQINQAEPRTNFRGEAIVGLERKDGSAVVGLLQARGSTLCTYLILAPQAHQVALTVARNDV
jgi:hypothetical protein